ncbi:VC0807 family protein [Priestia koreensis]|uniref:VC0807 family protein n=1 Tax=Priestia koreensis TaxID=284581 RepID=UPI00203CD1DC|nr:VC0807 family protein [Priestia koreensis]MCM3003468.1 hypothetical protein [Priestia koreensis]
MKNKVIFDLLFYIALPYLIWNQGRHFLGDYYAILLSTAPAFIYTIYTFVKEKQFNVTGLFLVITLLIRTIVDIISGKADTMLVNQAYFMFGLGVVLFITMLIKKPLGLYFFVDTAYLMGYKREESLPLFKEKPLFSMFQWLTLLFALRYILLGIVKLYLLQKFGVEGYGNMIVIRQVITWVFSIFIAIYTFFIIKKVQEKMGSTDDVDIKSS